VYASGEVAGILSVDERDGGDENKKTKKRFRVRHKIKMSKGIVRRRGEEKSWDWRVKCTDTALVIYIYGTDTKAVNAARQFRMLLNPTA